MKKRYLLSALFAFMCLEYQSAQAQTDYYVTVTGDGNPDCIFTPATLTIDLNDTLWFVHNAGVETHNSYSVPTGNPPNMWLCNLSMALDTCGPTWFTAEGTYTYNCSLHNGNGGTINVTAVGINASKTNEYSSVFPNPFHSVTTVFFNGIEADKMEVYNLMGQQIKSLPIKNGADQIELDLTEISSGVYFYRLLDEEGIIETKRLVKTR